jgi:ABC-type nitrate/sulfonate/bicarbonate transport system permease component
VMASIPCALSTWVGLGSVPAVQLKLADTLGMSRAARLLRVAAPSAAPHIVAGLRLAAVYVVVGVIAMEFVAAPSGLGYRIRYLYEIFDDTGMYAYVAIVLVLAVALAAALAALEYLVAAHRARPRGVSEPPPDAPRPGVRGLAAIAAVLVAAWWVVGAVNLVVPTPPATVAALGGLLDDPEFRTHLWATAGKVAAAAVLGTALGAAAGFALGRVTLLRRLLQAYLDALNAVPKLVLYPALVGILGFGPTSQVAMGALFAFFPVMTNVSVGAQSVPPVLDDLARSLGLGRVRRLATVVVPAIRRPLLVGCRLGTSLAVIGVVVSEIVATRTGLGRVVMRTYGQGQYEEMMAVILTMVTLASLLALGLRSLERRVR